MIGCFAGSTRNRIAWLHLQLQHLVIVIKRRKKKHNFPSEPLHQ
uniref:Uncharacterized protein n=1 Tax=Rhizophora mucronata TaxID=61149 RepID=A0A2P2PQ24_RHIMU